MLDTIGAINKSADQSLPGYPLDDGELPQLARRRSKLSI